MTYNIKSILYFISSVVLNGLANDWRENPPAYSTESGAVIVWAVLTLISAVLIFRFCLCMRMAGVQDAILKAHKQFCSGEKTTFTIDELMRLAR